MPKVVKMSSGENPRVKCLRAIQNFGAILTSIAPSCGGDGGEMRSTNDKHRAMASSHQLTVRDMRLIQV